MKWDDQAFEKLRTMLVDGVSISDCAKHFNVSLTRIGQIIRHRYPEYKRSSKIAKARAQLANLSEIEAAQVKSFAYKKSNAKSKGFEFTIEMADIDWPTHCPVLGIELDWLASTRQENSPSYDRLNSDLGYVPGNVKIVSWRANRIKNDGTAAEHRLIAEFIDRNTKTC